MYLKIEILIFYYILLCICIIVYNISYIIFSKFESRNSKISLNKFEKWIELGGKCSPHYFRRLSHMSVLSTFVDAYNNVMQKNPHLAQNFILNNINLVVDLTDEYAEKTSLNKAYCAYMVTQLFKGQWDTGLDDVAKERLSEILLKYVSDNSIYCRENALQALYTVGNVHAVVGAYLYMNRSGLEHNSKLVVDGLATFKGDKLELGRNLLDVIDEVATSYKVSFIDYMRMISGNFSAEIYDILIKTHDDEVAFAAIRYFRKYYYKPVREYLFRCMDFEKMDWQYGALAAHALENYPGKDTVKLLIKALKNRNWYIRLNATESLLKLDAPYHELQSIYNGDDRYAREMIIYKMREDAVRKESKEHSEEWNKVLSRF